MALDGNAEVLEQRAALAYAKRAHRRSAEDDPAVLIERQVERFLSRPLNEVWCALSANARDAIYAALWDAAEDMQ